MGAALTLTTHRRKIFRERSGGGSYQAAHDPRIVFGLGEGEEVISLEIRWPSGVVQTLEPLQLRQYHTVEEPTE